MACSSVSARTGISKHGCGLLGALFALIFMLAAWVSFSAVHVLADEGDEGTESQAWAVCGNFAFTLSQGATCETLDSTEVDSAL